MVLQLLQMLFTTSELAEVEEVSEKTMKCLFSHLFWEFGNSEAVSGIKYIQKGLDFDQLKSKKKGQKSTPK